MDFGLSRRMDSVTEVREILGTPEYVGECSFPLPRRLLPPWLLANWWSLISTQGVFLRKQVPLKHCIKGESSSRLSFRTHQRLRVLVAAPEILNYEPITTATDMW